MEHARIHPDARRNRFARTSIWNKAGILGLIAAQALCQQGLQHFPAKDLHRVASLIARSYHTLSPYKIGLDSIINSAEIAHHLTPWNSECVAESLVLWTCLQANGYPALIRIGCRNVLGVVEAHMWVELNDKIVLDADQDAATWRPFDSPWPTEI